MFSGRCLRVRPQPTKIDAGYLSYFFGLPAFKEHIRAIAVGATMPSLNTSLLSDVSIPHPVDIAEQRAIAHILGTLDDKIELNRRMNETLEAMARALFKSWFVNFDPVRAKAEGRPPGLPKPLADLFPARLVDSELGEIPEGWGVGCVDDEFDLTMGQSPPGETYNEVGEGVPFYQGRADFGSRFPTRRVYCTAPTRLAQVGDTLVSVRAPVGDINMATEDCAIGRGVAAARHKSGSRPLCQYE
jgi:type I restriction enzyme S subunit